MSANLILIRFLVPSESIWAVALIMPLACCFTPDESAFYALLAIHV